MTVTYDGYAGTEHRAGSFQWEPIRYGHNEVLVYSLRAGVSTKGPARVCSNMPVLDITIVSTSHALATHVLLPSLAPITAHTTVHYTPNTHSVTNLVLAHVLPHCSHHPGQLMSRHTRVICAAHVIVSNMHIRVANTTKLEFESDILISSNIPLDLYLTKL